MDLGTLKKSLSKLPPDMNDMEVIIMTLDLNKNREFHLLGFTGILKNKTDDCVALGSDELAMLMIEEGTFKKKPDLE